ncbi:hypothetical protein [Xenorhabdus sp. SGI240]|uniref:hypothetical protein n=1 Tax=Xenorhabdus sp. SGI240 TaxID=3158262 RepID=UPI0032B7B7BB
MRIELINDKDPLPRWIVRHSLANMGHEILLGSPVLNGRLEDFSGRDFQIGYQALRTMPDVFAILSGHLMRFHRGQCAPFPRLNTGFSSTLTTWIP